MIRRGDSFARSTSVPLVEPQQNDISPQNKTYPSSSNSSNNGGNYNIPSYKVGDVVYTRIFGDPMWYSAKVTLIKQAMNETGGGKSLLIDLVLEDDGSVLSEVEEHMISPFNLNSLEDVEMFYDNGIYQRGDYVEICMSNGIVSTNVWKRGRVAIDKKFGCYDIRMENGSDEANVRGRYMRHHYRAMEAVDIRILHGDTWCSGKIIQAEKYGMYHVSYDNTASGQCHPLLSSNNNPNIKFRNNSNNYTIAEEVAVYAKRLLPSNRYNNNVRSKAIEYYKSLHRYYMLSLNKNKAASNSASKIKGTRESISLDDMQTAATDVTGGAVNAGLQAVQPLEKQEINQDPSQQKHGKHHHKSHHHHQHGKHHHKHHHKNKHHKDHDDEYEGHQTEEDLQQPAGEESYEIDENQDDQRLESGKLEDDYHIQRHVRNIPREDLTSKFESMQISSNKSYSSSQPAQPISRPNFVGEAKYVTSEDHNSAAPKPTTPTSKPSTQPAARKQKYKVGARIHFHPTSRNGSMISLPGVVVRYLGQDLYRIILDDEDHEMEVHEDMIDSFSKVVDHSFDHKNQSMSSAARNFVPTSSAKYEVPQTSASLLNEEEASQIYDAPVTPIRASKPPQNSPYTQNKSIVDPRYNVYNAEEEIVYFSPEKQIVQHTPPVNWNNQQFISSSSTKAVARSPVPEMQWIAEPTRDSIPSTSLKANTYTSLTVLKEGMRVEYKPSNATSFAGVITYADPNQQYFTVLLEDGNVLDQVNGNFLFPIKKGKRFCFLKFNVF